MFGMGFGELVLIFLVGLVFLGPEKLPETASKLGKWFYELKRQMEEVKSAFEQEARPPPPTTQIKTPSEITPKSAPLSLDSPKQNEK